MIMTINLFLFLISVIILVWFIKNIQKYGRLWIVKGCLQIGILILFVGSFIKLFVNLPPNIYLKLIFCFVYMWGTVGINVNFMIPLIALIDNKIEKYK